MDRLHLRRSADIVSEHSQQHLVATIFDRNRIAPSAKLFRYRKPWLETRVCLIVLSSIRCSRKIYGKAGAASLNPLRPIYDHTPR